MASISKQSSQGMTIRQFQIAHNRERYAYLFMRLSGVGLLILAVGHMLIQHVLNSSANLTIEFVAQQWNSWGWKAYDILLLWLAIPHGINGLRHVLADYIHNESTMRVVSALLALFVVATVIWATIGMALFDATPYR